MSLTVVYWYQGCLTVYSVYWVGNSWAWKLFLIGSIESRAMTVAVMCFHSKTWPCMNLIFKVGLHSKMDMPLISLNIVQWVLFACHQ